VPRCFVEPVDSGGRARWITPNSKPNLTLAVTLGSVADPSQRCDDLSIRLRATVVAPQLRARLKDAVGSLTLPDIDARALRGLKFNEAIPERLADLTLAARLADFDGAASVLREPVRFTGSRDS
jgi:ATP-dependent Lhr-like helicase